MKTKIQSKHKLLKAKCDKLWSEVVKIRAGYKSELSNSDYNLQSHHVLSKPCYSLRYSLENGICLAFQEHIFGIHNHNPGIANEYFEKIIKKIEEREGKDIFGKLMMLENVKDVDLNLVYILLKQEKQRLLEAK